MGKIAFALPRISSGEKYGSKRYKQKGPTCWYYAAKMLSKLHGDAGRQGFRELHWVRKAISEVSDLSEFLGEEAVEDVERVATRLEYLIQYFTESINQYEAVRDDPLKAVSRFHTNWVREAETRHIKMRLGVTNYAAAVRKRIEMRAALVKLRQVNDTTRYLLLNGFINGLFHRSSVLAATMTAANVEKILRRWGPFYASGSIWTGSGNVQDVVEPQGNTFGADTLGAVDHFEEGSHAVLVAGIDTDTSTLYYKDPNNTAQVRSIAFGVFHQGWVSGGSCTVITITCPNRNDQYNGDGGCQHAMTEQVMNSFSEMLGGLFG